MNHRLFLAACGALLLAACTIEKTNRRDVDGGEGGSAASGGASSGGSSSGGTASGDAGTGGDAAGGRSAGGGAAGGAGNDAGLDADAAVATDAAPDALPTADASDAMPDPFLDGGACATDTADSACTACIKTECCGEWLACDDDACAGDGASNLGELLRFQDCMISGFQGDAGVASVNECAGVAVGMDGGALSANTRNLVECIVAFTGTSSEQRCSTVCFGGNASP